MEIAAKNQLLREQRMGLEQKRGLSELLTSSTN